MWKKIFQKKLKNTNFHRKMNSEDQKNYQDQYLKLIKNHFKNFRKVDIWKVGEKTLKELILKKKRSQSKKKVGGHFGEKHEKNMLIGWKGSK